MTVNNMQNKFDTRNSSEQRTKKELQKLSEEILRIEKLLKLQEQEQVKFKLWSFDDFKYAQMLKKIFIYSLLGVLIGILLKITFFVIMGIFAVGISIIYLIYQFANKLNSDSKSGTIKSKTSLQLELEHLKKEYESLKQSS